jgi:hypothetical protein
VLHSRIEHIPAGYSQEQMNIEVTVKRADYTIEELDVVVNNDTYKIIAVDRMNAAPSPQQDVTEIRLDIRRHEGLPVPDAKPVSLPGRGASGEDAPFGAEEADGDGA